jgi:ankyrin repeat protein
VPSPDLHRFWEAAESEDLVTLGDQVAGGVDVNAPNPTGDTALMAACVRGHLSIVQYLVKFASDRLQVNAQNPAGWTAVMIASAGGHLPIVQYLVRFAGANINIPRKVRCAGSLYSQL